MGLILKLAISFHTFADDGEAVRPELLGTDVDAKSVGEFCRALFTCGCKQVLVIRHKVRAALLVDGVQACCEEQSKSVGEIVEG